MNLCIQTVFSPLEVSLSHTQIGILWGYGYIVLDRIMKTVNKWCYVGTIDMILTELSYRGLDLRFALSRLTHLGSVIHRSTFTVV